MLWQKCFLRHSLVNGSTELQMKHEVWNYSIHSSQEKTLKALHSFEVEEECSLDLIQLQNRQKASTWRDKQSWKLS